MKLGKIYLIFLAGIFVDSFYRQLVDIADANSMGIDMKINLAAMLFNTLSSFLIGSVLLSLVLLLWFSYKWISTHTDLPSFFTSTLSVLFMLYLLSMYIYGMYSIISSDKYSAKKLIIATVIAPYPIYIGTKEIYSTVTATRWK